MGRGGEAGKFGAPRALAAVLGVLLWVTGCKELGLLSPKTPSRLVFATSPASATAGASLSPAVQVLVEDSLGSTVTTATTSVTLAIGANPAGATLSGTTTVAAVSGVATFSAVSLDKVGAGYTLIASAGSLTGATSSSFNVNPSVTVGIKR